MLGPNGPKLGKRFFCRPYGIFQTDVLANGQNARSSREHSRWPTGTGWKVFAAIPRHSCCGIRAVSNEKKSTSASLPVPDPKTTACAHLQQLSAERGLAAVAVSWASISAEGGERRVAANRAGEECAGIFLLYAGIADFNYETASIPTLASRVFSSWSVYLRVGGSTSYISREFSPRFLWPRPEVTCCTPNCGSRSARMLNRANIFCQIGVIYEFESRYPVAVQRIY